MNLSYVKDLALMRYSYAFFSVVVVATTRVLEAQTGQIVGQVVSAGTRLGIAEATVTLEGSTRTTLTTMAGRFRFDSIPTGVRALRVSAIGYRPFVQTDIAVGSGRPAEVTVVLQPRAVELEAISAVAATYFRPPADAPTSTQTLGAEEIRRTPGGFEDVLKAVALLPGVSASNAARNDLVVRGGAPQENLFVLDGIEIPNLNHFGSQGSTGGPVSLINVDLVREVRFSAGGFGVRYGDRIGSVTDLTLREGNGERMAGNVNLSSTGFSGVIEGPVGGGATFVASVRRSFLDLIFNLANFPFLPRYYDAQAKLAVPLSPRDKLTATVIGALDDIGFNNTDLDNRLDNARVIGLNQQQYIAGLVYTRSGDRSLVTLAAGRTFTRFRADQTDTLGAEVFRSRAAEGEQSLRAEWKGEVGRSVLTTIGATAKYADRLQYEATLPGFLRRDASGVEQPLSRDTSFTGFRIGTYAELAWNVSPRLTLTTGARLDRYAYLAGPWRAAPRVAASLELGPGTSLTASVGRWWQTPSFSWLAGDATNAGLQPFRADQVVLGLQRLLRPDLKLQVEAYVKRYGDYPARVFRPQSVFAPAGFEDVKSDIPFGLEPLDNRGVGRAYGVEVFLQKKLSTVPVYGLLSVAAARSEFAGIDGTYRPGPFDQRLLLTALTGWRPSDRWELSGKVRVATGAPTTPFVLVGPTAGALDFARYNAGPRTPIFHALDVRADRRFAWRSRQLVLYLDVQNIYGRKNISAFAFNERTRAVEPDVSLGILPTIGVNLSF